MRADWKPGDHVSCAMLVREAECLEQREGRPYIRLTLGDRSGTITANVWNDTVDAQAFADLQARLVAGTIAMIAGTYKVDKKYGPGVKLSVVRPARDDDDYQLDDLVQGPPLNVEHYEAALRGLVELAGDGFEGLLAHLFTGGFWARFRVAPAARSHHQSYRHGLLEHTVAVTENVLRLAERDPTINTGLAVAGALVHDVGKADAYTLDPLLAYDLTDVGRLYGEIPLGFFRLRRLLERLEGMDPVLARGLLHIQLAHHGRYEWGSPVLPATREAMLVHFADMVDSRMGEFAILERDLPDGGFSGWSRTLGREAWFPPRPGVPTGDAPEGPQDGRTASSDPFAPVVQETGS
jgi:3'-5' exoribonuclease